MEREELTFDEIDRRLKRIPEGPASALNPPEWLAMWDVVGVVGIIGGLLPSVLIKFLEPHWWMVFMAQAGLVLALIGVLPGFVRNTWALGRAWWRWRREQTEQLDHEIVHFRALTAWLRSFPPEVVSERLRFVRIVNARLNAKASLLVGGLDKLGVVPIAIAFALQIKDYADGSTSLPYWLGILGIFLALTYLIAFLASLMSLRLRLYESVLAEAVEAERSPKA